MKHCYIMVSVLILTVLSLAILNAQENDDFFVPPVVVNNEVPDEPVVEPVALPADAAESDEPVFEIDRGGESPVLRSEDVQTEDSAPRPFWSRLLSRSSPVAEPEAPEAELVFDVDSDSVDLEAEDLSPEQMLAMQEEVRRQAAEVQAKQSFNQADVAIERGEYNQALTHLNEGMSVIPVRPHTMPLREEMRKKQAECEYRLGLNFYRRGQLDDAKHSFRRAEGYYPADRRASKMMERISRDEARVVETAAMPRHPRRTEEYADKRDKLNAAMRRGKQYFEIKDYEKAKYEFRSVLQEDAVNDEAILHLKRIAEREYNVTTRQADAYSQEMMVQVRSAWTPPLRQEIAPPDMDKREITIISPKRRNFLDKLNTIIIPEITFRQANIIDVVDFLVTQSQLGDTKSPENEKGVNIILNLKGLGGDQAMPPSVDDPFAAAIAASASPGASDIPTATLRLRNVVLIEAIKIITELTGLKYRLEEDVVVITPAGTVDAPVLTRTYRVQPTIQEIIMTGVPSAEGAGFLDLSVSPSSERGDVRNFFIEAGVPFPEGTSIVYKPSINLLIVSNTEDNLDRLEKILATIDAIPTQVEIEARFVEIAQKDLMEIGVEWRLTDDWTIAQQAGVGAPVPLSARERLQVNKNIMTKGLRYLGDTAEGMSSQMGGDAGGILSISSVLTNPELTFLLHLLEQRSGVNLLSAPKVTTKSGANAEIKVVKELIYPTTFEIIEAPVAAGYEGVVPRYTSPGGFEVRDVGVVLNVTPVVGPDGYTIDLTMLPQVVQLAEWVNYGSTIEHLDGSIERINIPQPIFHSRSIATSISIWDGQTVVMGGLITEEQVTTEDKVPFLGDIPLIGALFRSKTSISEKRNLLIFVTARLVDPSGNKVPSATSAAMGR